MIELGVGTVRVMGSKSAKENQSEFVVLAVAKEGTSGAYWHCTIEEQLATGALFQSNPCQP